ncbi:MAG TPA: response regulator [Candidatus Dormibacteraeota bacterium]|nr:response regulator [Candidatus Dormibacteraeota bacterium]
MARILLIDDDDAVRRVMRSVLERKGHEVLEANNGKAGVQLLAEHAVDLVITDIFMPEQDGVETVRQMRIAFPQVKVIVASGGDSTGRLSLLTGAELFGATASLSKPLRPADLLAAVQAALESAEPSS